MAPGFVFDRGGMMQEYVSLDVSCSDFKARNPALLAYIAERLSSIVQPDAEFNPETIYIKGTKNAVLYIPITYSKLSEYFRRAAGRHVPALFETSQGPIDSNKVMVNREWLDRQVSDAEKKARSHGGELISDYKSDPERVGGLARSREHHGEPSEVDNDKVTVRSAEYRLALMEAENRLAEAESLIVELKAKEKASVDDSRNLYNELRAKDRKIQEKDAQIELLRTELDVFLCCFNPESPVHPKGLYEAFQCWQAVTENGTRDPSGPGGRGAQSLVLDWLRSRGEPDVGSVKKPGLRVKRLATVIGWRGRGSGAIRSK